MGSMDREKSKSANSSVYCLVSRAIFLLFHMLHVLELHNLTVSKSTDNGLDGSLTIYESCIQCESNPSRQ